MSPYRLDQELQAEYFTAMENIIRTGAYRTATGWSTRVSELVAAELRLSETWEVVPTRSGTDALVMALTMAGVRPGAYVAAPDLAYHAVGAAILQVGALPRWIDVDPITLNMDVAELADAFDRLPLAAVIGVDNYGTPCDRAGIARLCAAGRVPFVLDACESLGTPEMGANAASLADFVAVSFSFTKPIHAAGTGGALCAPRAIVRDQGGHPGLLMHPRRLPELNAAYLVLSWPDLPAVVVKLRSIYAAYEERLRDCHLTGQPGEGGSSRIHAPFLLPDGAARQDRDALIAHLAESGFEARPYFESQSRLWGMPTPRRSADLAQRVICLPTGAGFPSALLDDVAAEVVSGMEARHG
ncbi:DegT/DnrJ/EryC1/StrS family aminotransferase [Nonomuraea cavernae]|uniref:DegT/DnrJ/EryC1/StrS family aminotransferase n=1 Tax=Nonomuraea cavernae TaxID=2045107 RepID=UPI0033D1E8CE